MRVVGCFLEYNNEFVLLKRRSHKPDGSTWGLPAGKVEPNESDETAMIRELYEETGYQSNASELKLSGVYDFVTPSGAVNNFVTYSVKLSEPYEIVLEDAAHSEYKWASVVGANKMPDLIFGLHDLFKMVGYIS
jgi:8-oxo-dGTP pyrophosphatase MutT (NUDIX family)